MREGDEEKGDEENKKIKIREVRKRRGYVKGKKDEEEEVSFID